MITESGTMIAIDSSDREPVPYDDIPDDVLEDLIEAEKELEREIKPRNIHKRRYPSNKDIVEVIKRLAGYVYVDPEEFPNLVREELEKEGFYTGLVTDERIWRLYETLVRSKAISDFLSRD